MTPEIETIKQIILAKFTKALQMELPVRDIIAIGQVIASFEANTKMLHVSTEETETVV